MRVWFDLLVYFIWAFGIISIIICSIITFFESIDAGMILALCALGLIIYVIKKGLFSVCK